MERSEKVLGEELPSLAKKVARVETVRKYAGKVFYFFCFIHRIAVISNAIRFWMLLGVIAT